MFTHFARSRFTKPAILFSAAALALLPTPSRADPSDIIFRKHVIAPVQDSEYIAATAFDVNHDGKLDIVCGGWWYEAPTWKKHYLRTVEVQGGRPDGYAHLNLDVNGDGWMDIITVNWRTQSVRWIENPGPNLAEFEAAHKDWPSHIIATPGSMETGRIEDILGDGTPCILVSTVPYWYELVKKPNPDGKGYTPEWVTHQLPRQIASHGIGIGDVNGDGRADLVGQDGWLEAPVDRRNGTWIWHADWSLDRASVPMLVKDVDGDGLNDIVFSSAHDYGVYWMQQTRTADKKIKWVTHVIDSSWAGAHAPFFADMDGDGKDELIVGRRYRAHEGGDGGEYDPQAGYRYSYDSKTKTWHKYVIDYNDGIGWGVDPKAIDLTGSGRLDLILGGRNGLYWLENMGKGSTVAAKETHDPLWFPAYSDHMNLMVLKDEAGAEKKIATGPDAIFAAGARRAQTQAAIQAVIGTLPDSYQRAPLDMKIISETPVGTPPVYTRQKITYASDLTSRVSAYLLVPVTRTGGAVLCLHDDIAAGKDEPAGVGGRDNMHYADELARKGFVCLVPDHPSYGENKFDFKANAANFNYASPTAKAVWDNLRGLDLLETEFGARTSSMIGHGLGGQNALLTAAMDYRVASVVSSGGFTSFQRYTPDGLKNLAVSMPRIADMYKNDASKIPFDYSEVLAAIAPHRAFISAPAEDSMLNVEGVNNSVAGAMPVFTLRGGSLTVSRPAGGHDFVQAARDEAYAWLSSGGGGRGGRGGGGRGGAPGAAPGGGRGAGPGGRGGAPGAPPAGPAVP